MPTQTPIRRLHEPFTSLVLQHSIIGPLALVEPGLEGALEAQLINAMKADLM